MKDLAEVRRRVDHKRFAGLVDRFLIQTGWTERDLATEFGCSQSSVNRWRQPGGQGILPSLVVRNAFEALARSKGIEVA